MPVLKIRKNGEWVEVWGSIGNGASIPKLTTITMFTDAWSGSNDLYSQVVACDGVSANSKLDLQPTPEQISMLQDEEISLMAVNINGVAAVYVIGNKPTIDISMQVLISEVSVI